MMQVLAMLTVRVRQWTILCRSILVLSSRVGVKLIAFGEGSVQHVRYYTPDGWLQFRVLPWSLGDGVLDFNELKSLPLLLAFDEQNR